MEEQEKIYFYPGDVVELRQNIENKPSMIVIKKDVSQRSEELFKGIRCLWFTSDGTIQEYTFNTKDLVKI